MNIKFNKRFLILPVLILFFGVMSFFEKNYEYSNNIYIKEANKLFENFFIISDILNYEKKNYIENNFISRYSVKEIRDRYVNMRNSINKLIGDVNRNDHRSLNEEYLVDILEDLLKVVSNSYLVDDIFGSKDDLIIKNFEVIMGDFSKVLSKYNLFKINFAISSV